jgi:hypothetical protein
MMSDRERELGALQARIDALKTTPSVFNLEAFGAGRTAPA